MVFETVRYLWWTLVFRSKCKVWIEKGSNVLKEPSRLYICPLWGGLRTGTVSRKHFSSPLVECFRGKDASWAGILQRDVRAIAWVSDSNRTDNKLRSIPWCSHIESMESLAEECVDWSWLSHTSLSRCIAASPLFFSRFRDAEIVGN